MPAIPEEDVLAAVRNGHNTHEALKNGAFGWLDDPRWLGMTVHRLIDRGVLTTPGCDPSHNHGGGCRLEVAW
jgi:hypothetical protein